VLRKHSVRPAPTSAALGSASSRSSDDEPRRRSVSDPPALAADEVGGLARLARGLAANSDESIVAELPSFQRHAAPFHGRASSSGVAPPPPLPPRAASPSTPAGVRETRRTLLERRRERNERWHGAKQPRSDSL
jgi:hypothetical protein